MPSAAVTFPLLLLLAAESHALCPALLELLSAALATGESLSAYNKLQICSCVSLDTSQHCSGFSAAIA